MLRELAATDRLLAEDHEIAGDPARARRPLHPPGARRRPAAHAGDPADRPQPARLRPLPHPQRLRGRRTARARPQRLLDRHWPTASRCPKSIAIVLWGTDNLKTEGGPIAQALALIGARPALRQLRPPRRRRPDPARRARPAADRRGRHPVRHLPRPAAPADQAARRGRVPGRRGRRAGRAELRPQARAGLPGEHWLRPRDRGAACLRQRRGRLRLERQPPDRERRWDDEDELAETYAQPQGLRLRPHRQSPRSRRPC